MWDTTLQLLAQITHWHWLALGVVLIVGDVFLNDSFYLLWSGLSATVISLTMWYWPELTPSMSCLLFLGLIGFGVAIRYRTRPVYINHRKLRASRAVAWDEEGD